MTLLEKSTPGRRKSLLALAAAKRRNKRRIAQGLKPIVEGKAVSPDSLSKHYGPGAHPGTGTDQTIHDPGTGGMGGDSGEGGGAFGEGGALGGGGETEGAGGLTEERGVDGELFDMDAAPPPSNVPADFAEPETSFDQTIRPQTLDDFVGQDNLKSQLDIMIDSARQRNAPLDHTLFTGPPGLGKTTLAKIVGNELGADVKVVTAGAIRNKQDVAALVLGLEDGDILFIDEIHALDESTAELLYPVMEDFEVDVPIGDEVMRIETPKFTLMGATTRAGALPAPLRSRFGAIGQLDYYEPKELSGIVDRTAGLLELNMDPEATLSVASRARGTPRIANNLTKFMRDYSISRGLDTITPADVDAALAIQGVDGGGLTRTDRKYLSLLSESPSPVGVSTIASFVGEESQTVEDAWEPFLLREGYIMRTPRGRIITERGLAHLQQYGIEKRFYKAITNTDPMRCIVVNCLKDHLLPGDSQETEEEEEPVAKHGDHDQSTHGNWARGRAKQDDPPKRRSRPRRLPTPGPLVDPHFMPAGERFDADNPHFLRRVTNTPYVLPFRGQTTSGFQFFVDEINEGDLVLTDTPFRVTGHRDLANNMRVIYGVDPDGNEVSYFGNMFDYAPDIVSGAVLRDMGLTPLVKSLFTKHGSHDQKSHGNWARGTSARQMLADAISSGEPRSGNRGLTRYMPTGSEPDSGVGVGMSERTQWFPSEPSRRQVREYVRANADLLNQTNGQYHIGFWEAPDGRWSLDVSQVFETSEGAFKAFPNEEAVFDYATFEPIYNPGL